ncbi:hypothetical protein OF83DRAFT_1083796 [Amylostereum chailletii]|nr:hypothetical protein OF83DRAFT_1083796 [Amylostereum chailletii]
MVGKTASDFSKTGSTSPGNDYHVCDKLKSADRPAHPFGGRSETWRRRVELQYWQSGFREIDAPLELDPRGWAHPSRSSRVTFDNAGYRYHRCDVPAQLTSSSWPHENDVLRRAPTRQAFGATESLNLTDLKVRKGDEVSWPQSATRTGSIWKQGNEIARKSVLGINGKPLKQIYSPAWKWLRASAPLTVRSRTFEATPGAAPGAEYSTMLCALLHEDKKPTDKEGSDITCAKASVFGVGFVLLGEIHLTCSLCVLVSHSWTSPAKYATPGWKRLAGALSPYDNATNKCGWTR